MPLPEDVHRRLAARAATDLDVACMLATFAKADETVSDPSLGRATEDAKTPEVNPYAIAS